MATQPEINPTGDKTWANRHETFTQPIDNLYNIINGDSGNMIKDYNAATEVVQDLIGMAQNEGKSLRALGSGWSFSTIAATEGWLLNTMNMNLLFNVSEQSIADSYTGNKTQLLFVQCGISVQELNRYLETNQKSLKTSGASNGQTISGAISTGTHGAALNFGATQEFVVGLHMVTGPGRNIWLERASYPVVSGSFISNLQAEIVKDDELFNAALVNIGSFGFIHGVMIETEPIYLFEGYRQLIPYDDTLKNLMQTLNFSNSPLPHGSEVPFHFQALINQYDLDAGVYVTTLYKRPYNTNYAPPVEGHDKAGPGDDAPVFIGKLTDFIPATIPTVVNALIKSQYTPHKWWGTSGEIFSNTDIHGKVLSTAMGIPAQYVNQATNLLLQLNSKTPFPGVFAYRYVKQSKATLAFTQYENTCVIELDGVRSDLTWKFFDAAWNELLTNGIPFTFHWGKINNLDDQKIKDIYKTNRDKWVMARNNLLPKDSLPVFSSPTIAAMGLDEIL